MSLSLRRTFVHLNVGKSNKTKNEKERIPFDSENEENFSLNGMKCNCFLFVSFFFLRITSLKPCKTMYNPLCFLIRSGRFDRFLFIVAFFSFIFLLLFCVAHFLFTLLVFHSSSVPLDAIIVHLDFVSVEIVHFFSFYCKIHTFCSYKRVNGVNRAQAIVRYLFFILFGLFVCVCF